MNKVVIVIYIIEELNLTRTQIIYSKQCKEKNTIL